MRDLVAEIEAEKENVEVFHRMIRDKCVGWEYLELMNRHVSFKRALAACHGALPDTSLQKVEVPLVGVHHGNGGQLV